MARYDVFVHPDADERESIPFLLAVQNSYLDLIDTTVVVPLYALGSLAIAVSDLNPTLHVQGHACVLNTAALGSVPNSFLRNRVANLSNEQRTIQNALDILFGGY